MQSKFANGIYVKDIVPMMLLWVFCGQGNFSILSALEMSLERLVAFASDAVNSVVGVRDELATASSRHSQLLKHAMEDTIDVSIIFSSFDMYLHGV